MEELENYPAQLAYTIILGNDKNVLEKEIF
jgi:hypothetical protein